MTTCKWGGLVHKLVKGRLPCEDGDSDSDNDFSSSLSPRSDTSWKYPTIVDSDDDDEISKIRRRKAERAAYGIIYSSDDDEEEENVWSFSYTFFYNYYLFDLNFSPR